ncbi:MAG: stalk domain-containing protein [Firmicutes bacterium]|nr:stalk domain-containing protein [Bacillota bacterium]
MKKVLLWAAIIQLLAILMGPVTAFAAEDEHAPIVVIVNGAVLSLDTPPLIEAGRTLIPLRAIAESLGASVDWDSATRKVGIALNEDELVLIIDSKNALVNDHTVQMDVPARIVENRTLVPARFISESFHAEVGWDEVTRTVTIITYVNEAPFSAALVQLEAAVLQELNLRREKLSRAPLICIEELTNMARSQAAELAKNKTFTHISSRFGDTTARARARGIPVHFEYLAYGLPDALAIAESLLRGEYGARLLAKDALYCGLGFYKGSTDGNADIYGVAELTEGAGLILGTRPRRLEMTEVTLKGYAVPGAPLILYMLDDENNYTSRSTYNLNVDSSGRFQLNLLLPSKGRYAAVLGMDSVILIIK